MIHLNSGIEGKRSTYGVARDLLERLGYSLDGSWDYNKGVFDAILSRNVEETIYLRIPFHTLEGKVEQRNALIRFDEPYVVKHVVNTGLDKDGNSLLDATGFSQFQEPLDTDGQIKRKSKWEDIANKAVKHIENALNSAYENKVIVDKKELIQVLREYLSDQKQDIQFYRDYIRNMENIPEKAALLQIQRERQDQISEIVKSVKILGGKVKDKAKSKKGIWNKFKSYDTVVSPSSLTVELGEELTGLEEPPATLREIHRSVKLNLKKGADKKTQLLNIVPLMDIFYMICDHMIRDHEQLREWVHMERLDIRKRVFL